MAVFTLLMCVELSADGSFDPLGLIYIVYSGLWVLGIFLQYFEYKRGMPHAWYAHQLFWILNAVLSAASMGAFFYLFHVSNFDNEMFMKVKYLVCTSVSLIVSTALAVMGVKYKREHPQHLRNYLSTPIAAVINEPLIQSERETMKGLRQSQVCLRIPIIKGAVMSYTVENGAVHFKIFAFKDQVSMWSVKKTYQDFA